MAVTVASGKRGTFKGTSAVDTFIINDDTKGATITNVGGGDIIAIEGFATDFTAKVSGRVVTLTSTVDTGVVIKFQLAATSGTASIRFLDGDLTATHTAKVGKVAAFTTLGTQKLTAKAVAVSDETLGTNDSVTTFDETAGGGSSSTGTTFTLTTGGDNALVVGSTGNDTYNGVASDTAAATDTFNTTDVINGGTGDDVLNLIFTGTNVATTLAPAEVSGIEAINVRALQTTAATVTTVTSSNFTGATAFNADRATSALTVSALAQGQSVGMVGNTVTTNGALVANYAATATSNTLNISGGTTAGAITVAGTGLLSTTINSTGGGTTGNTIGAVDLAVTVTSATVNATTALTTGAVTGGGGAGAVASLTVTGAGAVTLGGTLPVGIATLTASAMTGALTATLSNLVTQTVTLGSGNDVITTGAVLTTGSVAAGTGTDTLAIGTNVTHVNTAALGAKYTGFETLRLNGTLNMATTLSGITAVQLSGATNSITNMTATQAAAVTGRVDIGATTFALATATGTSDVLSLTMGTGAADATEATDIGALTVTGFETLNVATNAGTTAVAADKTTAIASFTGATLANINLTGTAVSLANIATTVAVAINGSALTGDGAATSLGLTVAGNAVAGSTITGSAVGDRFTMGAEGSTYNGAAGNDTITTAFANLVSDGSTDATIIGGTGNDTLAISDTTVTMTDNHFTNVSGMELLTLTSTVGDLALSTGGAFNAAYATGVTIVSGTLAVTTDAIINMGLYNQAATITIDATSLVGTAVEDHSIITGGGADTVTFTGDDTYVGVTGADAGTIVINTRGGADTISVTVGTLLDATTSTAAVITGGTGVDAITKVGTNATHAGASTGFFSFAFAEGDSLATTTGFDTITGFDIGTAAIISDGLNFAGTGAVGTLATSTDFGVITSHNIATGVALFDDAATFAAGLVIDSSNLAAVVGYLSANVQADGIVAFVYDSDASGTADATMVFHQGAATDSLVLLAGVTTLTILVTTNASDATTMFVA